MLLGKLVKSILLIYVIAVAALPAFSGLNRETKPIQDQDDEQVRIILRALSRNVMTFKSSLPDFVCQEELAQEITAADGKIEEKKVIKSSLTGSQHKEQTRAGSVYDFEENREISSINGKKPPAPSKVPPPYLSGSFSSILLSHFAVSSLPEFEWSLERSDAQINGRMCFVLRFVPSEARNRQIYRYDEKEYESRRTGRAFVDKEAMQVVRIEFAEGVLPDALAEWHSSVDYAPVRLDNDQFWLPISATTTLREKKSGRKLQAVHHFTDYKRFTGSIKLEDRP